MVRLRVPRPDVRLLCITMLLTVGAIFIILFSIWALSLAGSFKVRAHEAPSGWSYPTFCCHNLDCAPTTLYRFDPVTGLVHIQTKFGHVSVPLEGLDKRTYESGDGQTHACIVPDPQNPGGFFVRCVFLPKGM